MSIPETRPQPSSQPAHFYGYIVVIASFTIMTLTFGINSTFGVFFEPLIAHFGWTRAATSAAYSLLTIVAGFWGIIAGRINDRLGPKFIAILGGVCFGAGFLLMSRITALWQLYVIQGILIAIGIGGSWPVLLSTVAKWFVAKRGMMIGIVACGIGFGMTFAPPLTTWLISVYGWRSAYVIMGIGTMVVIVIASLFLWREPHRVGQLPLGVETQTTTASAGDFDYRRVLRTGRFWVVCLMYFFYGYYMHTVTVHIVPHSTGLGLSPSAAANVLAIMGGMSIVSRLTAGVISDRIGIKRTLVIALTGLLVSLVWVQTTGSLWGLILFGVVFGISVGGPMTMQSLLLAEMFGLGSLGVIVGISAFVYTIGSAIGPAVAGYIFDITGSYSPALLVCSIVAVAAVVLAMMMKPVESNRGQNIPGTD